MGAAERAVRIILSIGFGVLGTAFVTIPLVVIFDRASDKLTHWDLLVPYVGALGILIAWLLAKDVKD